jgi:large subunit ribosomal protein L1
MGKKKVAVLGTENEETLKVKKAVKLEQKKLREGKEIVKKEDSEPTPSPTSTTVAPENKSKPAHTHHGRSHKYQAAKSQINPTPYSLRDGLNLLRSVSTTTFDPTVELHITLKEKSAPKEIELPHSTGKTKRIAIATDETIAKISAGQIDFDVLLATPTQMAKLVKLAKVLGPKGLMPNPKTGTIVNDPESLAKSMAAKNSLSLKTEKDAPLIHLVIGKLSLSDKQLTENISAVLEGLSGLQVKKIVLKSTMSPAIKLDY